MEAQPPSAPSALLEHKFLGHKDSVLCVAVNPLDEDVVCSGSEDGTARIWDLRKKGGIRCLQTHKHSINSVLFSPNPATPLLYCAEGHAIYCYDLRRPEVVLKDTVALYDYNAEEINQISLSEDGKLLAACDDSGETKIIDLEKRQLVHTLARRHKNICTSVLFRRGHAQEVITGGLDCNIVHWNIVRARHIHQEDLATEPKTAQTFNPPMAHSLSLSGPRLPHQVQQALQPKSQRGQQQQEQGHSVAVGLGDGTVAVYTVGSWARTHNLIGHNHTVSVVEYAAFAPDTHLFSGSDDCTIVLWDLRRNQRFNMYTPAGANPMLLQINNGSKVNHLASSSLRKLFVADQSNDVSVLAIRE